MTTIPDGLPTLARGKHGKNTGEACVMEYVSVIAGEEFSDFPECTDKLLAKLAQAINDCLTQRDRHLLVPFIDRLATAKPHRGFQARLLGGIVASGALSAHAVTNDPMSAVSWYGWRLVDGDGNYNPERAISFLDDVLTMHEEITRIKPRPIPPEELAKAKALIESRSLITV